MARRTRLGVVIHFFPQRVRYITVSATLPTGASHTTRARTCLVCSIVIIPNVDSCVTKYVGACTCGGMAVGYIEKNHCCGGTSVSARRVPKLGRTGEAAGGGKRQEFKSRSKAQHPRQVASTVVAHKAPRDIM